MGPDDETLVRLCAILCRLADPQNDLERVEAVYAYGRLHGLRPPRGASPPARPARKTEAQRVSDRSPPQRDLDADTPR
jgi:hypothetical protein